MRLIDADALIDKTDDRYSLGEIGRRERDDIVNALEYAPTITAQPKTGKWIDVPHTFFTKCSACEWLNDIHDFDYCPNCGARMKEGD